MINFAYVDEITYFKEVREGDRKKGKVVGYEVTDRDPGAHAEMLRRHKQHKKAKAKRRK